MLAGPAALAATPLPVIQGNTITGVRDARYCEIIPVVRKGLHLEATVYNTLGLNDCPASVWEAITEDAMKQRFGAITVLLNGPRHFLMDQITASGATNHRPYREQTIDRDTVYLFKAGRPVFMLEAPGGARYVMQAYAGIVDKTLTYDGLPALGTKLNLPAGWDYTSMVPDKDLILGAAGKAIVVQDGLDNTYQKLD
jgi:hypothetical protein